MKRKSIALGVNIDHIAVLREARRVNDPDPLQAVGICHRAGAHQITIHLREDRRHINDDDAVSIIRHSPLPVNLECAMSEDIVEFVCRHKPLRATIVPEKREEVTTEGGLSVTGEYDRVKETISRFHEAGVEVSLFIDPVPEAVLASRELGSDWVEFHTGSYANIHSMLYGNLSRTRHSIPELERSRKDLADMLKESLMEIERMSEHASSLHMRVAAGHGLNYGNVSSIAGIPYIEELNIGQSIVARSVFCGLERAITDMLESMRRGDAS
jgi:pyridoxine 5-phosphate synthase